MIIDSISQLKVIQDEIVFRTNEFESLLIKNAARMFVDKQLYLAKFLGFDELRGNILLDFDHKICFPPRQNEHLLCFVSEFQDNNVKNWGGKCYRELRSSTIVQFDAKTVFFEYKRENTVVGISGIGLEEASKLKKNSLVFLAPSDPPLMYLMNIRDSLQNRVDHHMPYLETTKKTQTDAIELPGGVDTIKLIVSELKKSNTLVLQGPPGTGKTHLMAAICNHYLSEGKRIMVTALTNTALIELAENNILRPVIESGKVYKSALTANEARRKSLKGLQPFKSLSRQDPQLLLSSFYIMSNISNITEEHFDLIIIEEASQAFLPTITIAKKLGKKCIVIGDIKQLRPIFHTEYQHETTPKEYFTVNGLEAIDNFGDVVRFMLTKSYRLTNNSILATNSFYNGKLISSFDNQVKNDFSGLNLLYASMRKNGGPSILTTHIGEGRTPSKQVIDYIQGLLNNLLIYDKNLQIAVLAFHKDTIRFLQKEIFTKHQGSQHVTVETVDRVQGLSIDLCIYLVMAEAAPYSLDPNRFNVATSRAKIGTIIILEKEYSRRDLFPPEVDQYLKFCYEISEQKILHTL